MATVTPDSKPLEVRYALGSECYRRQVCRRQPFLWPPTAVFVLKVLVTLSCILTSWQESWGHVGRLASRSPSPFLQLEAPAFTLKRPIPLWAHGVTCAREEEILSGRKILNRKEFLSS